MGGMEWGFVNGVDICVVMSHGTVCAYMRREGAERRGGEGI